MADPVSYVKAGAGRGAATILPDMNVAALMNQATNQMAKMAQLKQVKDQADQANIGKLLDVSLKVWQEGDGDAYREKRDEFEALVTETTRKYGFDQKRWSLDVQNAIKRKKNELYDFSETSLAQQKVFTHAFKTYMTNQDKHEDVTKENLIKYMYGTPEERTKLANEGLLVPKQATFDWKKSADKVTAGTVGRSSSVYSPKTGQVIGSSVNKTDVDALLNNASAVYASEFDKMESGLQSTLGSMTQSEQEKYSTIDGLSPDVKKWYKDNLKDEEYNPRFGRYLDYVYNRKYQEKTGYSESQQFGSGYTKGQIGVKGKGYVNVNAIVLNPSKGAMATTTKTLNVPYTQGVTLAKPLQILTNITRSYNTETGEFEPLSVGNRAIYSKEVYDINVNGKTLRLVNAEIKETDKDGVETSYTHLVPYTDVEGDFKSAKVDVNAILGAVGGGKSTTTTQQKSGGTQTSKKPKISW